MPECAAPPGEPESIFKLEVLRLSYFTNFEEKRSTFQSQAATSNVYLPSLSFLLLIWFRKRARTKYLEPHYLK